jgi:lipopolysaccharide assembly protein A
VSQLIVFLGLAFSIVIAIFAVQNSGPVAVSFLTFGPVTMAASVLVLISAALGALAILLLGIAREVSLRWRQRALGQQLKAANARIATLEAAQPQPQQTTGALPPAEPTGSIALEEPTSPPAKTG